MGDFGWIDGGCGVEADLRGVAGGEGEFVEGGWAESHDCVDGRTLRKSAKQLFRTMLKA